MAAFKTPFQIFPGIFSSIDSYSKRIVDGFFEKNGRVPAWLSELGDVKKPLKPPHFSKFNALVTDYDILLTGNMDAAFLLKDGTICIADYKTSKFTGGQDKLLSMYTVQLNAYALIAERTNFGTASKLALVYFEPETEIESDNVEKKITASRGFALDFSAYIKPVELDVKKWTLPYLQKAREVSNLSSPPDGKPNCQDCEKMNTILSLFN